MRPHSAGRVWRKNERRYRKAFKRSMAMRLAHMRRLFLLGALQVIR